MSTSVDKRIDLEEDGLPPVVPGKVIRVSVNKMSDEEYAKFVNNYCLKVRKRDWRVRELSRNRDTLRIYISN